MLASGAERNAGLHDSRLLGRSVFDTKIGFHWKARLHWVGEQEILCMIEMISIFTCPGCDATHPETTPVDVCPFFEYAQFVVNTALIKQ